MERADRPRRRRHRRAACVPTSARSRRTCASCSRWRPLPARPSPPGRRSPTGFGASTTRRRPATYPKCTGSPRPSRRGGPQWRPQSPPAIPTQDRQGYNRLAKHQGRNAFGFRNVENQRRRIRWACTRQSKTNADAYAGPAPANTDGRQLKSAGCPVTFNEPAKYLAAPAELHWARWGTGQIHHDPPTLTEAEAHQYKPAEEKARTESEGRFIVGTPSHVKAQLQQLATDAQAHEVMTVNLITDHHAQHIAEVVRPYGAMSPESSQRCKQ